MTANRRAARANQDGGVVLTAAEGQVIEANGALLDEAVGEIPTDLNVHERRVREREIRKALSIDLPFEPDRVPVLLRDKDGGILGEFDMQARTDLSMGEQEILNRVMAKIRAHQLQIQETDLDDSTDESIGEYEQKTQELNERLNRLVWQINKIALIGVKKSHFAAMSTHQRNVVVEEFFKQAGAINPVRRTSAAGPRVVDGPKLQPVVP
jgi:hypothetical protein